MGEDFLIFSDLHLGLSNDSEEKLSTAIDCVKWIGKTGKELGIKYCVFLGDWNNNRFSLGVKTVEASEICSNILCDSFEKVIICAGNHDMYYSNNDSLSSVSFISPRENLLVVTKEAERLTVNGKEFVFCPWFIDPSNMKFKRCDVLFGHFEANGFVQPSGLSFGQKYEKSDLCNFSNLVFTGHYHLRKTYCLDFGTIEVVGCPYEQNWSDYQSPKGVYVLNSNTLEYRFIENTVSPRHFKLSFEKLKKIPDEDLEKLFFKLSKNHIKIFSSSGFGLDEMSRILSIGSKSGCDISSEYEMSQISPTEMSDLVSNLAIKSKSDYINKFICSFLEKNGFGQDKIERIQSLAQNYQQRLCQ